MKEFCELIECIGFKVLIEVDGGVNLEIGVCLIVVGVDVLVVGNVIFVVENLEGMIYVMKGL